MKSGRAESSWNDIQCTYCSTGETAKLCISCCRFSCRLQGAAAFAVFTATETSVVLWSANSHLPPYGPTFTSYNLWTLAAYLPWTLLVFGSLLQTAFSGPYSSYD